MRRKALTFEDATKLQAEAESLMAGSEHELDSRRVLELVRDSDCSAYDCEFAALAIALGVKLVTMDAKLQNKNAVIYGGSGAIGGAVARARSEGLSCSA
jgi:predicted nucleic acid-binding protein